MQIKIRQATLDDIPWLLDELKKFSKFYATKRDLFPSDDYASTKLGTLIIDHVAFVAENNDELLGFIVGMAAPHFFNPSLHVLTELFWWVEEKYRGSRAGYLLLDKFLAYGKIHADWISFTLEENSPVKDKILLKNGFHIHERSYLLET